MNTQYDELIRNAAEHSDATLYRDRWGSVREFPSLPTISRSDILAVPLPQRRYKNESSLVKIVRGERPFLSEWSFGDIGMEEFGLLSQRPLVYMSDPYEAIEKSMWCYRRGMVPLIGEKDPDIAMFAAEKYAVDSLITDPDALLKMRPYLETHRLSSISVIGSAFHVDALAPFSALCERLRLVLALPEAGAFADAPFSAHPTFAALPGCRVDREETLIVTKERLLVTPIIKYRTDVPAAAYGDGA